MLPPNPATAARRLDPQSWKVRWWLAIFAAGAALRIVAVYPTFRSPLESDILQTALPLGTARWALPLLPLLTGIALLAAYAFFVHELAGDREGRVAFLLLAVPPSLVLLWTSLPFGDAGMLLCMTVALGCATHLGRRAGDAPWAFFVCGLAAGLGWWCSPLSLAGTVPAALWILLHRPALLPRPRGIGLAVAGLALGALPWVSAPLHSRAFPHSAVLDRPIPSHLVWSVPTLLLGTNSPRPAYFLALLVVAGGLYLIALGLAAVRVASRRSWAEQPPILLLPLLIVIGTGLSAVAGRAEGDGVRAVLPLCLAAPLLLAALWGRLSRRHGHSTAADALLVLLLVVHASGYVLPGMLRRTALHWQALAEDHLVYLLEERHTAWVFGRYDDLYALNVLCHGRLQAIPDRPEDDIRRGIERILGPAPGPFALVSLRRGEVAAWARRAGWRGELVNVNDTVEAFFPVPNPPSAESPAALIARLRAARVELPEKPPPLGW
jgi:F0F1-type ATP synthase membrane subunit c/vacuolar-type H+-ATPase subunit K